MKSAKIKCCILKINSQNSTQIQRKSHQKKNSYFFAGCFLESHRVYDQTFIDQASTLPLAYPRFSALQSEEAQDLS